MKKLLVLFICFVASVYAEDQKAFLNIISNASNTQILLDGKDIGTTPIKQYAITPNQLLKIKAIADKNYYKNDIYTTIRVENNTIPTVNINFEKAQTQIFFVGEDAELYIEGTFIKKLNDSNRVVTVDADTNLSIQLRDGYSRVALFEDIKAGSLNTLHYTLITIPKDVRLYTSTQDLLMWEDTKDAANTNITWEDAQRYCENLTIAQYDDFRLPTLEELQGLYTNKEIIYNGYGGKFYWSSSTSVGKRKIWEYAEVKNFDDAIEKKSIKEFDQGRVRCVRDI